MAESPRSCGDCQACCTVIQVEELKKPLWTRCENQCDTGCAIYDDRPEPCSGFKCLWLQGALERDGTVKDTYRPDRMGVIFDHQRTKKLGRIIKAFEVWPGASNGRARRIIEQLARHRIVVIFREDERVVKGPPHLVGKVNTTIHHASGDTEFQVSP